MFSIDQNCHSLWDTLPKLHVLSRRGLPVRHFIEDIDVAFTSLGSDVGSSELRMARERFYRGGAADWGAAMFYSEFLGKLPVEIRRWEPYTGLKTSALARQLGCTVDELYEQYSQSDNWQLIGASYVADRDHHRVVGDLSVAETAEFLIEMLRRARANCLESFPQVDSQQRTDEWFDCEERRIESLLERTGKKKLVDLYRIWLSEYLDQSVTLELCSSLFANHPDRQTQMLDLFLRDYDLAAGLYNEAIAETDLHLRPVKTADGELPFFATLEHQGHLVRTGIYLEGKKIRIGKKMFDLIGGSRAPMEKLCSEGVLSIAGKAIVLVIQVRMGAGGEALVVPYRGSSYFPAVHRLSEKLTTAGLLTEPLKPIFRVRFSLLDRLKELSTTIHLPEHLASCFGKSDIPANQLGENYASLARQASERLEAFKDPTARARWQRENFPDLIESIDTLERRRRELASGDPKAPEIRELGKQQKQVRIRLARKFLDQIARDTQVAEIDYWDSRGALLPWCIALGGETFYNHVIDRADLYEDPQSAI